ncbi:PGPGW domain-containing protein [Candidatus Saccharibacteria bacterium]|nr:PGPGW domain-containing protein [Candidatus Saccharibacteria bacterium]
MTGHGMSILTIARKLFVGVGGTLLVLVGVILLPTPAPEGWLIIFAGIAFLATEFSFAKNILKHARRFQERWAYWFKKQPAWFQAGFSVLMILVVIVALVLTIWWILSL